MSPALIVRRIGTDEEVHRVELRKNIGVSYVEKVLNGLLRNMDLENFYVDESEVDEARADEDTTNE
ncbi:MAG: hypothetical protein DRJ50_13510 [Actinobacteria bacterium]|nr:MAG: hypothetical protein DRJ50_13510 [Actinomycetota bacterium]